LRGRIHVAGTVFMRRIASTTLVLAGLILGPACSSVLGSSRTCQPQRCKATGRIGHGPASRKSHNSRGRAHAAATLRPFGPDSIWNAPLDAHAPLDPRSRGYVAQLVKQVVKDGPWINTSQFSTPVFTVPAQQPMVRVKLDNMANIESPALQRSWAAVPVPRTARAAQGTDAHMVVWQPSTDRMWEFWEMRKVKNRWHAAWGGTMDHVSSNPGYYAGDHSQWGATASSLPLLGGLIRPSELAAGQIDHALSLAIPAAEAAYFTWPAQRTDGYIHDPVEIPEGQRFRLDPRLDLSKLSMSPIVRTLAVAAQKYGIVVRDQSGAVTFYAEDTSAEGKPDPYHGPSGFFESQYINNLLKNFPWSHLQALKDKQSCCWHK
jgi:hypothetical protein